MGSKIVGYHAAALFRFLIVAIPLLLLAFVLHAFALSGLGWMPDLDGLSRYGLGPVTDPPPALQLGGWILETLALTALFLLVQGRSGSWWLDGLATGWIAWVFRGPVMVLTIERWSRLPRDPWWPLALRWLVLYTVCGLLLALVARRLRLGKELS